MRQTLYRFLIVISFAVATPLLVWALKYFDACANVITNPQPKLEGPLYLLALLVAFVPIIAGATLVLFVLKVHNVQVNWRTRVFSATCTVVPCAIVVATAAVFRRSDDAHWLVFSAMIGVGVGVLVAAMDTYMN